jgi:hypothetical protein
MNSAVRASRACPSGLLTGPFPVGGADGRGRNGDRRTPTVWQIGKQLALFW